MCGREIDGHCEGNVDTFQIGCERDDCGVKRVGKKIK